MRNLVTVLILCLLACAACAELANDNTTVALWHMNNTVELPSGQPMIADDDYGTNYFNPRGGNLTLGGTPNQWASNPSGTADRVPTIASEGRPGGSGYSLQYDGVNDWAAALNIWNGADFEYGSVEVEFWFKPLTLPTGTNVVYLIGATVWELRLRGDGQLQFMTRDQNDAVRFRLTAAGVVEQGSWYHVILNFTNGSKTVSVKAEGQNDYQVWTVSDLSPMKYQNAGIYMGGSPSGSFNVNMLIDKVKISVPNMPGVDQYWQSPREDDMNTLALLHFDEIMDPNISPDPTGVFTPDDNSFNPRRRAFHSKLFDFDSPSTSLVDSMSPEFGKCLKFDGWNDRVLVAFRDMYDYVARENLRIESWVKLSEDASDVETGQEYSIVSQLYSFRYHYLYENGQWMAVGIFGFEVDGVMYGSTMKAPVANPRDWNHIAIQWHRGQMSLYINGELRDRRFNRAARVLRPSSTRLAVGSRDPNPGSSKFMGLIDEVRFVSTVPQQAPCADGSAGYPAGDVNRDCDVNILDFAQIAFEWLNEIDTSDVYDWSILSGDLNYDRIVDQNDLYILAADWLIQN